MREICYCQHYQTHHSKTCGFVNQLLKNAKNGAYMERTPKSNRHDKKSDRKIRRLYNEVVRNRVA